MYVVVNGLVKLLSKFDPKKEPAYVGSATRNAQEVHGKLGPQGVRFYFGVGGMYCLNRLMLEEAEPYLV